MLDAMYSYLIDASGFFFFGWLIFLVLACVVAFRHDRV